MVETMSSQPSQIRPTRRVFLGSVGSLVAWAQMPRFAFADTRDPRFVTVVLRGAVDGIAVVPPTGDPDYVALRGELAIGSEAMGGAARLDGMFALNDAMPNFRRRFAKGEALVVHAVASPYRERSHFDGQDVLESGTAGPRLASDGWLSRAVEVLPQGARVRPVHGLAVSPTVPLILRGSAPVFTWMPNGLAATAPDTADRLMDLYAHTDPLLHAALASGREVDRMAGERSRQDGGDMAAQFARIAAGAGRLLAEPDGPRVAAISYDGWDTHADEGPQAGRLEKLLSALDGSLEALAVEIGPAWQETVVAVVTEFGRTARANGTEGTDHGTRRSRCCLAAPSRAAG